MFRYKNVEYGNIFDHLEELDVIIHSCNCRNTMGAGFAKALVNKFNEAKVADDIAHNSGLAKLGFVSSTLVKLQSGKELVIVNMYTQENYGTKDRQCDYDAITATLNEVALSYQDKVIGMPLFSTGLAGGDWGVISEIISRILPNTYRVFAYRPVDNGGRGQRITIDAKSSLYNPVYKDLYRIQLLKDLRGNSKVRNELVSLVKWYKSLAGLNIIASSGMSDNIEIIKGLLVSTYYNNIIIAGGRDFKNKNVLYSTINRIIGTYTFIRIITGFAKGADMLGYEYAVNNNIPFEVFKANWSDIAGKPNSEIRINNQGNKYWVKAGFVRNRRMLLKANTLVAFWDGRSKGTKDMIAIAKRFLIVKVFNYQGEEIDV